MKMIDYKNKLVYKAFGLKIESEIVLPELVSEVNISTQIVIGTDIKIKIEDLSKVWNELKLHQNKYVVQNNLVMFAIKGTAIFSIQEGKRIVVSPIKGSDEDKIRLYILGTCMGALLMQRNILPLHGSAVAINGKAYAFVGDRGAGKSTLAAALINRGYQLLSDDLIPVSLTADNTPIITPSYPQQKLWQESLEGFGMECNEYKPLFERETKYAVPVNSNYFSDQLPLAGVFELGKTKKREIEINPVQKLERLHILYRHTFRSSLIPRLGLLEWHFNNVTKFVSKIGIHQLCRPTSKFTAESLSTVVLNTIGETNYNNIEK